MNYYLDTEFLEGTQTKRFLGIPYGKTKPTIDLISIGLVSDDNREYYAISKDFNLEEAWNRYDIVNKRVSDTNTIKVKNYWIRDNVLKPIFNELYEIAETEELKANQYLVTLFNLSKLEKFKYSNMDFLIKRYGKSNKEIATEVLDFCRPLSRKAYDEGCDYVIQPIDFPKFYAYFADYDWVAFCWLFGKMMDLPKGFPMYCFDLNQLLNEKVDEMNTWNSKMGSKEVVTLKQLKSDKSYPKLTNEHNALDDAKWNKKLHEFIKSL